MAQMPDADSPGVYVSGFYKQPEAVHGSGLSAEGVQGGQAIQNGGSAGGGGGPPGFGGGAAGGYPPKQCTTYEAFEESTREALIVLALYAIVVLGRWVHDPEALETVLKPDFWVWAVLLIPIGAFLKVVAPKVRDSLLNASIFNIILLLLMPLKHKSMMMSR